MSNNDYQENFDRLYKLFSNVHVYFYAWKGLQNKGFEEIYRENNGFWLATIFSLENQWLINLAKIYEDSRYSRNGRVISVHALIPLHKDKKRARKAKRMVEKHNNLIKNIRDLRHNSGAHNNIQYLKNPQDFFSRKSIKYKEVEELLDITGEILLCLNPETGHGYSFQPLKDQQVDDSRDVVTKLKYFNSLKKKHLEKFKRGEINNPVFPPEEN